LALPLPIVVGWLYVGILFGFTEVRWKGLATDSILAPANVLGAASLVALVQGVVILRLIRIPRPSPACWQCGYERRGIIQERPCPECGAALTPSMDEERTFTMRAWCCINLVLTCVTIQMVIGMWLLAGAWTWFQEWVGKHS